MACLEFDNHLITIKFILISYQLISVVKVYKLILFHIPCSCLFSFAHVMGQIAKFLEAEQSANLHTLGSEHFAGQACFASSFVQSMTISSHISTIK